jgi:hypothetical protein
MLTRWERFLLALARRMAWVERRDRDGWAA